MIDPAHSAESSAVRPPGAASPGVPAALTILMPAHNEQEIIAAAVTEWHAEVISKLPGSRLLVIDDASADRTPAVLQELSRSLPGVDFLRREVNGGHGQALMLGFRHAQCDFIFQTDSDRQHCPADFWRLWELRDRFDFVFGVRATRQDGAFRRLVAGLMRGLNWLLFQVWIADANCPFKLMRRQALMTVLQPIPDDAFIPMVMISILSRRMHFRVAEAGVRHLPRRGGTQSLRGVARWARVGWLCVRQLTRLRLSEWSR